MYHRGFFLLKKSCIVSKDFYRLVFYFVQYENCNFFILQLLLYCANVENHIIEKTTVEIIIENNYIRVVPPRTYFLYNYYLL